MADLIRLLACAQCQTIEEMADYQGPPEQDHVLSYLVKRHRTNDVEHIGALFTVEEAKWSDENVKRDVAKQIAAKLSGGETGLGHAFYDLKDTLKADALACFNKHQRNPACSDYRSDSKRLTPGTAAERKAAGLPEYRSNKDQYLCSHCPVQSMVDQAARAKAGLYK